MLPTVTVLLLALQSAPSPAPTPASPSRPEIAAEVERGRRAYNTQDLAYYDATLAPDAVYIADDGAVFSGKERVMQLFTRIFGRPQKPQLEIGAVTTGGKGDVAWARFDWTLSGTEHARPGVATVIFERAGDSWRVASIQNTAKGHTMRAPSPAPSPSAQPHEH
jgi:uncharacterized protein (TIGR02246 family)